MSTEDQPEDQEKVHQEDQSENLMFLKLEEVSVKFQFGKITEKFVLKESLNSSEEQDVVNMVWLLIKLHQEVEMEKFLSIQLPELSDIKVLNIEDFSLLEEEINQKFTNGKDVSTTTSQKIKVIQRELTILPTLENLQEDRLEEEDQSEENQL